MLYIYISCFVFPVSGYLGLYSGNFPTANNLLNYYADKIQELQTCMTCVTVTGNSVRRLLKIFFW